MIDPTQHPDRSRRDDTRANRRTKRFQETGETEPPSIPSDKRLGATFGRYQIERVLGGGAMGTVYLAKDTSLNRVVALKVPNCSSENRQERARFQREAHSAAALRHPNICPVFDVGEIDDIPFLTMQFVDGETLEDRLLEELKFSPRRSAQIVQKLALALASAHEKGIVHRDIKPSNVMIDRLDEPIVMDFGLARPFDQTGTNRITQSGMMIGSPAYMSPEQAEGDASAIGPMSDVYSLGVILFELLTGRLPYEGSMMEVLTGLLTRPTPSPRSLRPDLDPQIDSICRTMLAKNQLHRFSDMQSVADALQSYLDGKRLRELPSQPSNVAPRTSASESAKKRQLAMFKAHFKPQQEPIPSSNSASPGPARNGILFVLAAALLVFLIRRPASNSDKPSERINSIGMKLVKISAGTYDRGSDRDRPSTRRNELPRHAVRITRDFYLSDKEVTKAQWKSLMGTAPWLATVTASTDDPTPAVHVSWHDAQEFVKRLSEKEGRSYRLPTEAEWEYACRAGTEWEFSFGESTSSLSAHAWYSGNISQANKRGSQPVGQMKPNSWGLYDMHGNVLEWCQDAFDENAYNAYKEPLTRDPVWNASPSNGLRTVRGGAWTSSAEKCRSTARLGLTSDTHRPDVGFRLVEDW